jgi:uncharacterized damage-inducible protein DinB
MTTVAESEVIQTRLAETQRLVHRTAAGLSSAQLEYRPEGGRWSVAENLEHITVVEQRIVKGLERTLEGSADVIKKAALTDEELARKVDTVMEPLVAPEAVRPTSRWPSTDLLKEFDATRQRTVEFAATLGGKELRHHFMAHPYFGELDSYQWLLVIASHSVRHCRQCEAVKACAGYPR